MKKLAIQTLFYVTIFGSFLPSASIFAQEKYVISPSKTERMRRTFKNYVYNPSDENLAMAQDIVNALRQDNTKETISEALQKKLDAVKANVELPGTKTLSARQEIAVAQPAYITINTSDYQRPQESNKSTVSEVIDLVRSSAVQMASQIIDERVDHFEAMRKQKEALFEKIYESDLKLAQMKHELALAKLSHKQAQDACQSALQHERTVASKEHEKVLQEKELALQELAKNKQLTQSLRELETHLATLRKNHASVISKLEQRVKTAEQNAQAYEVALHKHIRAPKELNAQVLKNELLSTRFMHHNLQAMFNNKLAKQKQAIVRYATKYARQEAQKNKKLNEKVRELELSLQFLRTNHASVIAKLESRVQVAEQQTHAYEVALNGQIKNVKQHRTTLVSPLLSPRRILSMPTHAKSVRIIATSR